MTTLAPVPGSPRTRHISVPHLMIRRLALAFAFLTNVALAALVIGMALPGTHRVLYPEAAGLTEIAPRVWTDAPDRSARLLALAAVERQEAMRPNEAGAGASHIPTPSLRYFLNLLMRPPSWLTLRGSATYLSPTDI